MSPTTQAEQCYNLQQYFFRLAAWQNEGSLIQTLFFLDDFPKPQIRTHPETTVALRGTNVTLTCKAVSSSDSPMSTTWRKDSEILYDADIQNLVRYLQQDGEILEYTTILHVVNVNFTDEGKYQCIISNHFGSNYSNKAELTVNGMHPCCCVFFL